ncbi:MAG: hypothetical protein HC866_18730 [Leptolyngbyaceae cyanobacterium RU_5_1]|nr:hypothetical protein [Leptolyngbyaceae cyanobacterium RU_5_1]
MSKVLTYRIELLQPALVSALDGDPNSAVAFDFFTRQRVARGTAARLLPATQN